MLSVGLTGGIGVGKTTVARFFAKKGAFSLDADKIVRKLLLPNSPVWKEVVSQWGPSILIPGENKINRKRLSEIVFKGKNSLGILLDILYPPLKREIFKEKEYASNTGIPIFLVEASQIMEAGWNDMFDSIVLVISSFDARQKRLLMDRVLNDYQIRLRMGFQWPDWVKIRYADFLIDNSGPLWKTKDLACRIYDQLMEF
ncbi:MAG: dephospho-CoA kinase [bacterium]